MTIFWENLEKISESEGLSAKEVCRDLKIPTPTYTGWKQGKTPRKGTVKTISDYLGISIDHFYEGMDLTTHQAEMVKQSVEVREVLHYCNRDIQREAEKKKKSQVVDFYLEDIRDILLQCTNKQQCELMTFIYDWQESLNKKE